MARATTAILHLITSLFLYHLTSVHSQSCPFQLTHSNIVSNGAALASEVVPVLISVSSASEAVSTCQSHCEQSLRMRTTCQAFSFNPTSLDTCYLYAGLVESNLQLTGTDRLYQSESDCSGNGGNNPVHCVYSSWSAWGSCSVTCDTGTKDRSRSVVTWESNGGEACDTSSLSQTTSCSLSACPTASDCVLSDWSVWSGCSVTCGSGSQNRDRAVIQAQTNGGTCNGHLSETQSCTLGSCPTATDCVHSEWSIWSDCSQSCGSGFQARSRSIVEPESNGGTCNGVLSESRDCFTSCAQDCIVSYWGEWSVCPVSCGGALRTRSRSVLQSNNNGGTACPDLIESKDCGTNSCPIDCIVSDWSSWSSCTASCDGGTQSRHRSVLESSSSGGVGCPELSQTKDCNMAGCATDCLVGIWSPWSQCSVTCGGGYQDRWRDITQDGSSCPHTTESQACNDQQCSCVLANWSQWSECSDSCGWGYQWRSRDVTSYGEDCGHTYENKDCYMEDCVTDCYVGSWTQWSACSKTCGQGTRNRERDVIMKPSDGLSCPSLYETETCYTDCGSYGPCRVSHWQPWEPCSASCGTGLKQRSRTVLQSGSPCPYDLMEYESCTMPDCSKKNTCQYSTWGHWSSCSLTCGSGHETRTRRAISYSFNCRGPYSETRACHRAECEDDDPDDCSLSEWSAWQMCSVTCGSGTRTRRRLNVQEYLFLGSNCGQAMVETEACHRASCSSSYCKMSQWSEWGPCSVTCGGGTQSKTRHITEKGNGLCPFNTERSKFCSTGTRCPDGIDVGKFPDSPMKGRERGNRRGRPN